MNYKLFISLIFIAINTWVFICLYTKKGVKTLTILAMILLIIGWLFNNKVLLLSTETFLTLIIFSLAQPLAWILFKLVFAPLVQTRKIKTQMSENIKYISTIKSKGAFIIFLMIPVIITINQLSIIWHFNI